MNNKKDRFSFWVPAELSKGTVDGVEKMQIKGIASSYTEDSDGEMLDPAGMDVVPFLTKGHLNWDHQSKKTSAAIVGEPTKASVVNGGKDLYIEGDLYAESEEARSIYKLAQILEKNSKTRRLGFSIEGQVTERGCGPQFLDESKTLLNPNFSLAAWNKIKKATITGCAITPCPKNPNTLMQIMKGESANMLMEQEYDDEIEEEVRKSFTAEGASVEGLLPEDVEGTKNPNKIPLDVKCDHSMKDGKCTKCGTLEKSESVGSYLKKSEIYTLIAKRYTTDVEKAKQIYSFIADVNQKLFNMTTAQVTKESIEKAFDFLNDAIVKSASADEKKDPKDEKNDEPVPGDAAPKKEPKDEPSEEEVKKAKEDEMEKAKCEAGEMIKGGKQKGEAIDDLVKSGYSLDVATGAVESVISAANAVPENGGTVTAGSFGAGIEKGKEDLVFKSLTETNDLLKSLAADNTKRFGALGTILKATVEQNDILKSQINDLTKSNTELAERIGKVENTPIPSKSARTVGAAERFIEKSQGNTAIGGTKGSTDVYDLLKGEDRTLLGERMMGEAMVAREGGSPNAMLEKAIGDLEISKSLPVAILPWLRAKGIAVVKGA